MFLAKDNKWTIIQLCFGSKIIISMKYKDIDVT